MNRKQFLLPPNQRYLCGHSLGPMTTSAQYNVESALQAWGFDGVKSWNTKAWIDLPHQVAAKIAPLIGAFESDVVVSDSTSVNLFKVLMSALSLSVQRHIILTTDDNFPADLYIAQGIKALHKRVVLKMVKKDELLYHLNEDIAVLMLTHVNYRDASLHDMAYVTAQAQQKGILTVWDLSHSAGALPIDLNGCQADFAVGCSYKYLNGGPGSPAFVYANKRHQQHLKSPIYGWMGHSHPFAFDVNFHSTGIAQYMGSTPSVLNLTALAGALELFDGIDGVMMRNLSLSHSAILIEQLESLGLDVITPKTNDRGGHVAFMHPEGYALSRALIEHGVTVDYREKGLIRLCVNPMYLTLADISHCSNIIRSLIETSAYRLPKYQQKLKVT